MNEFAATHWATINKAKWALILKAPFSNSGFNEIIITAETKKMIQIATGRKQFGSSSMWAIVKTEDLTMKVGK